MKHLKILLLTPIIIIVLCACSPSSSSPITDQGFYFDTIISITLFDKDQQYVIDHCFEMARTYENYFSNTIASSDISKINAAGGKATEVHPETVDIIDQGLTYGDISGGKFDITIGKLTGLWNLSDPSQTKIPKKKDIAAAVSGIDYTSVKTKGRTVTVSSPGAELDLGGIAKGYIADKMKDYMISEGVTSGLINLGGNVLVIGSKPADTPYTVGIQKPFSKDGDPIVTVDIRDQSVVTSGTYQRYIEVDGKKYHHILDPKTGYPVENGLNSVTIISDRSTDGDALSTICFILGMKKGLDLVESLDNTEAIFITEDNKCHYSSGMGKTIPFKEW